VEAIVQLLTDEFLTRGFTYLALNKQRFLDQGDRVMLINFSGKFAEEE
jgi:hypothetical protein